MNTGKTLFAQLMDFLPWTTFARFFARCGGDKNVRALTCAEQFRVMAFAQLTYRKSLRDIEVCLSDGGLSGVVYSPGPGPASARAFFMAADSLMETLNKWISFMPFDLAQESIRQACPECSRRAHNERNQKLAVRPELVEGLVQRFLSSGCSA